MMQNMGEQKPKNFIDVLEEAKTDICMHYCKQPDKCLEKAGGDGDLASAMLEEICNKCPLAEL